MRVQENLFDTFHILLVEPEKSLNIGAVARAMMNLGFQHLHLIAPREYDREVANITACWATPLLDTLQIHATFAEAIADMEDVVGLSGREARNAPHFVTLPQWSVELPTRPRQKTALVFGPEDNGLRQEHLNHCRRIIRIPSTVENPSFNLAQSVLLTLYEITKAYPEAAPTVPHPLTTAPTGNDYQQLDRLVEEVMTESGFLRDGTPGPVPGTIKNLLRRLEMTPQEMGILLGLFGRVRIALRRLPPSTSEL